MSDEHDNEIRLPVIRYDPSIQFEEPEGYIPDFVELDDGKVIDSNRLIGSATRCSRSIPKPSGYAASGRRSRVWTSNSCRLAWSSSPCGRRARRSGYSMPGGWTPEIPRHGCHS
jgi:hypothetical protein